MPNELANVQFQPFGSAGAIAEALAPGVRFRLLRIEVRFSDGAGAASAPSTSQALTVTLDAKADNGQDYDNLIDSVDPSVGSQTYLTFEYGIGWEYEADDEIDLAYTNTDGNTVAGRYVYELEK